MGFMITGLDNLKGEISGMQVIVAHALELAGYMGACSDFVEMKYGKKVHIFHIKFDRHAVNTMTLYPDKAVYSTYDSDGRQICMDIPADKPATILGTIFSHQSDAYENTESGDLPSYYA